MPSAKTLARHPFRAVRRAATLTAAAAAAVAAHPRVRPVFARVAKIAAVVSPVGWLTAGIGSLAAAIGWWQGWRELLVLAAVSAALIAQAIRHTFGSTKLTSVFTVPRRVTAGDEEPDPQWRGTGAVKGKVTLHNTSGRHIRGLQLELPIEDLGTPPLKAVSSLGPGDSTVREFPIPTQRRGAYRIGPAKAVRGDPLGLLRRQSSLSDEALALVHPVTVKLEPWAAGPQRDLDGLTTNDRSTSDVAFHALREYEPGDDLRHIHAMTSARTGTIMVRQFVDTRSAHLGILVSGASQDYLDEDEFETAMSIGASIALRGLDDQQRVEVLAAGHHAAIHRSAPLALLDAFSKGKFRAPQSDLASLVTLGRRKAPGTNLAVLISGARRNVSDFGRAASRFGPDVRIIAIRVATGESAKAFYAGSMIAVSVGSLDELRPVLQRVRRL